MIPPIRATSATAAAAAKNAPNQGKVAARKKPVEEEAVAQAGHQDLPPDAAPGPAGTESASLEAGVAQPLIYAQATAVVTDAVATTTATTATTTTAGITATAAAGLSAPVLAGAVVVGGAALGGGGGGGSSSNTNAPTIAVADGYIRDAAIWIDTDNDGTADYNTGLTTDAQGNFVLAADVPGGAIMAIGGVNIDTGIPNQLILRAPAGSTVINPLTTLLQNYIENSPTPITAQAASNALVSALGLSNGTDLTTFDPLAGSGSNDLNGQRAAAQLASLLHLGAGNNAAAGDTILDNLSGVLRNAPNTPLDLTNLTTLNTALTGVTPNTPANTIQTTTHAIQNAGGFQAIAQAQSQAMDVTAPAAPTLTLTSPGNDATPTVRVSFNTSAQDGAAAVLNNVVKVLEGATQLGQATLSAQDLSRGYVDITLSSLGADGVHTLHATLTDGANLSGTSSSVSHTLDTTAPQLTITSANSTTDSTPVISGTGENGLTVSVVVGGATYSTVVSGGAWNVDTGAASPVSGSFTALDAGIHAVTASTTDAAGNAAQFPQTLTVGSAAPTPPSGPTIASVTITGVTGALNNQLNAGDGVTLTVTFSEAVLVTSAPRLEVHVGSLTDYASYSSGSGQTALQFTYTIPGNYNTTGSQFYINPNAVDLNGGALKSNGGVDAVLTHSTSDGPVVYNVDTLGPVFTSLVAATVAENTATSTPVYDGNVAEPDTGFTYSLSGTDANLFDIYSTSGQILFKTSPDYEAPADANSDNVYQVTLSVTDRAGNTTDQNVSITVTDDPTDSAQPIQDVIDLGAYGKLIQPYQVDQNGDGTKDAIFYYWDRSGNGTSANTGSLNGGVDDVTYDVLNTIFRYDANGNLDTDNRVDQTYRYATLNGVQVALPRLGTSATNLRDEQSYIGLAELWDSYNFGTLSGQPATWAPNYYWTSDLLGSSKHYALFLSNGGTLAEWDTTSYNVALQVFGVPLDTTNPLFTSALSNTSFAENGTGTVLDANVNSDNGISYSLSGADASWFNINPSTGVITFKTAPDFEAPSDSGGNNVYDITVRGMELGGNDASQAVQITVTDVTEQGASYTLGQSQIDLGSNGKLINPVNVDGGWYYFWDRSGDGYAGLDDKITSHDVLDTVFRYNSALSAQNTVADTSDTFRFAALNGVTVGLPTVGYAFPTSSSTSFAPGTAIDNTPAGEANSTYNDLAAIWDGHNGTGTGTNLSGVPAGWLNTYSYASATSVTVSYAHAYMSLYQGTVQFRSDTVTTDLFVAVQVL